MRILIRGGRVVDPTQQLDKVTDLVIENGAVASVGETEQAVDEIVDAHGMIVAPGLVDMHVHLREPGYESKETIRTGTLAAVSGGVTTVACMPNTNPAIHDAEVVNWIKRRSAETAHARVEIVGSITRDLSGLELSDIEEMLAAGIIGISDDGKTTMDEALMEKAMILIAGKGIPLISHAEDHLLSAGGAMNDGPLAQALGIPGIPAKAEWAIVARDIQLAERTGARLHIAHISTKEAVELVRAAKARGVKVTAEAAPHHFILTDASVAAEKTETKVNPPLRSDQDVAAVLAAIADGTIDAIATDHAPHDLLSKSTAYTKAAFGISGIETSLALSYTELVLSERISMSQLIGLMSANPAEILGLKRGSLRPGWVADVIVFDPTKEWYIESEKFVSQGKNSPFNGMKVFGAVRDVYIGGEAKKREGVLIC